MNRIFLLITMVACMVSIVSAQNRFSGKVVSASDNKPLVGASIRAVIQGSAGIADKDGFFSLTLSSSPDTLVVSFIGYTSKYLPFRNYNELPKDIFLVEDASSLEEVTINTGFYRVPQERATGSFSHVDNELLNRSVGYNILQRLEGVVSGLQFVNPEGTKASDIRVRGLSTIESDETPLIILDSFPFEGDLNTINPNDVESVTVLKDAAAASIWGARAGNGVIVITTKQGRYNQKPRISFNSNATISENPDLTYSQKWLPSATVMGFERELFEMGDFSEDPLTPLSPYMELLIKQRDKTISIEEFKREEALMEATDVRKEVMKHLYQNAINEQYALNLSGGSENNRYYMSLGHDRVQGTSIGNGSQRFNLNMQNTYKLVKNMEVTAGIWYSQQKSGSNGLTKSSLNPKAGITVAPYTRLADDEGNVLPIIKDYRPSYVEEVMGQGLLDWYYRPVDEIGLSDKTSTVKELRLNGSLKYTLPKGFDLQATYQYSQSNNQAVSYYKEDSYYARALVNRYTQKNGSKIIPDGGIIESGGPGETQYHSGRTQLNYNRTFANDHQVFALGGADIRQSIYTLKPGYHVYGYDEEFLTGQSNLNYSQYYPIYPEGTGQIWAPSSYQKHITDRYLSYFGNTSYTYLNKYTLTGSARWDGSNLFGVKTNQRGKALWSIGSSWELSKEKFYQLAAIPYLRLRATYGSSGNVNKSVSHYPTIRHSTHSISRLPMASLVSVGNPSLRWEQILTANGGLDFATKGKRLSGSVDYYVKKASDLIGDDYMDPTSGIRSTSGSYKINYADMKIKGWDINLKSRNIQGVFNWETTALFSYVRDKIMNYNTKEITDITSYLLSAPPVQGQSRDLLYTLPWNGLNSATGQPIVYMNGVETTNYKEWYDDYLGVENLLVAGVKVPAYFGSVRNTFAFKGAELGVLLTWKAGYVFYRESMWSGNEYRGSYHSDYNKRWENPGDEKWTNVPSRREASDILWQRAYAYAYSEALVTNGDHIRLQDVNLSYTLRQDQIGKLPVQSIRIYGYARNLGILWKANKNDIDPDYHNSMSKMPSTYALGLQVNF